MALRKTRFARTLIVGSLALSKLLIEAAHRLGRFSFQRPRLTSRYGLLFEVPFDASPSTLRASQKDPAAALGPPGRGAAPDASHYFGEMLFTLSMISLVRSAQVFMDSPSAHVTSIEAVLSPLISTLMCPRLPFWRLSFPSPLPCSLPSPLRSRS